MAAKKKSLTVAEFVEQHSKMPYYDSELVSLALEVEGIIGDKARAWCRAKSDFFDTLQKLGFEPGYDPANGPDPDATATRE